MSKQLNSANELIDLTEIFAILWAHKIFITFITGLFIFISGYNALTSVKKYTAQAIFQIERINNNSQFTLPSELGALASIAGFAGINNSNVSKVLLERTTGREFILEQSKKLSLAEDRYFNTYDPNFKDPFWKEAIKNIIGWETKQPETDAIVESIIIKKYLKNVKLKNTEGGAIVVAVTHVSPAKAANYANTIMEEVRLLVEAESTNAQKLRLNYLSETLADSLQEMESTQESLKNYTLKNSALAKENFISGSLKLDELRMEKRKVKEISNLLFILEDLIKNENLNDKTYEILRAKYPLVDDVDFRRILGMSETISAWTWPNIDTIEAVSTTLRDRVNRLDINIKTIEENAKIYATSAEDLAKLNRQAKIAEATYKVLIEQVKSQSLAAGFQPETFKVFEYATPPLVASFPNRKRFLVIGTILGVFVGCALALINSIRSGYYFTRTNLISDVNAELSLQLKPIKSLSRKSVSKIFSFISKNRITVLDEVEVKLANKKLIFVFNSRGRVNAASAARLFALQSAQSGRNVVLCDTTGELETETKGKSNNHPSGLPIVNLDEKINVMTETKGPAFFTSTQLRSTIENLTTHFDQVFICASTKN